MDAETKVRKGHLQLMKAEETCLYSGIIMSGKTTVVDNIPTARTNGWDTEYGDKFMDALPQPEANAVILHENLHKVLKHILRHKGLIKEDAQLANACFDYVANGIIDDIKDKTLVKLPEGGLLDHRFDGWSVLDVWDYFKSGKPPKQPAQGSGKLPEGKPKRGKDRAGNEQVEIGGEPFKLGHKGQDEHDPTGAEGMSNTDIKEHCEKIDEAMRQGGFLAGRFGQKVPRVIEDALVKPINWVEETQDFINSSISGKDEYTYRKYNKRWLADDYYMPSTESETVGEIIISIDTSGSITGEILSAFAERVSEIVTTLHPDRVRVLWWDTLVHGEQVFLNGQYDQIKKLLKPQGGGGTRVGCVRDYIVEKNLRADCMIVFTDGYVEGDINWTGMSIPTLWLVTERSDFTPPHGGRMVKFNKGD